VVTAVALLRAPAAAAEATLVAEATRATGAMAAVLPLPRAPGPPGLSVALRLRAATLAHRAQQQSWSPPPAMRKGKSEIAEARDHHINDMHAETRIHSSAISSVIS
jgi:hypothetical protein